MVTKIPVSKPVRIVPPLELTWGSLCDSGFSRVAVVGDSKLAIQCLCGQWLFKWSGYKARVASTLDSWLCSAQSLGILPCNDAAHYFHHTHRENNGAADSVAIRSHEGLQSECVLEEVGRYYVLCFDGSVRNKCAAAGWILKTCERPGAPLDE